MSLKDTFLKGAETAFKVFKSVVVTVDYVKVTDDGFEDATESVTSDIRLIKDRFSQEDVNKLSFSSLIQPTDIKGLLLGEELPRPIETTDLVRVSSDEEFHVIAWEADPAEAVFTILLRET